MKISYIVKWPEDVWGFSQKDLPHAIFRHRFGTLNENAGWDEELIASFKDREIAVEFADFMNAKEVEKK